MNNFGIKQIGILKCQYGTPRGGLVNHLESGTWGDRGQGNELTSALENGLSWVGDKVINFWDYLDKGLNKGVSFIFGESLPTERLLLVLQLTNNPNVTLVDSLGNETPYTANVVNTGVAPVVSKLGKNSSVNNFKKAGEKVRLTKKQDASFKHNKATTTDDMRAYNLGRPVLKERLWDWVEEMMRKDPKAAGIINRYEVKKARGMDKKLLREARKKMLWDYAKSRPGFFDHLIDFYE